jgi:N utilization substance protein B
MANRHLSRSLALQSLFEWDMREYDAPAPGGLPDGGALALQKIIARNAAEFAPGIEDDTFTQKLAEGVAAERPKLDNIITKAAPEWPFAQIAIVDRNVLRIGLYELLFSDKKEVPARVAINEAIELAKTFGGETSGKFVNGVLGAVYREMGEPGKDDIPAKKKRPPELPYEQMPIEQLAGAVVYSRGEEGVALALVHDIFGYWTLTKGHLLEGEDLPTATAREVKKELSLDVVVGQSLGKNEYISSDPEKGKLRKQVNYFLAECAEPGALKLEAGKGGLDAARWFSLLEIPELKIYDDVVPFITKAIKLFS